MLVQSGPSCYTTEAPVEEGKDLQAGLAPLHLNRRIFPDDVEEGKDLHAGLAHFKLSLWHALNIIVEEGEDLHAGLALFSVHNAR